MANIYAIFCFGILTFQVVAQQPLKQVELYDETNFKGLMWQGLVPKVCVRLPMSMGLRTISLVTSVCITVFQDTGCHSVYHNTPSISLAPGAYPDLSLIGHPNFHFGYQINSFQECTDQSEARYFRATLYGSTNFNSIPYAEYNNIRGCINLPSYLVPLLTSVDNHGTCITLYKGVDCTGNATSLLGGVSAEASNLNVAGIAGNIRSLNLCSIVSI